MELDQISFYIPLLFNNQGNKKKEFNKILLQLISNAVYEDGIKIRSTLTNIIINHEAF